MPAAFSARILHRGARARELAGGSIKSRRGRHLGIGAGVLIAAGALIALYETTPAMTARSSGLVVTKTAPREVMLCDVIPVTITVTNNGTDEARGIRVTDALPSGLTTSDGKTTYETDRKSTRLNSSHLGI